jgi:PAS domain-containing protein
MRTIEDVSRELSIWENRVNFALSVSEIGVWEWKAATGDLIWNSSMLKLFGLDSQTYMTSDHLDLLVHPADLPAVKAVFKNTVECDAKFEVAFRIKYQGGWRRIVKRGAVHCDADGKNSSIIGVAFKDDNYYLDIPNAAALLAAKELIASAALKATELVASAALKATELVASSHI